MKCPLTGKECNKHKCYHITDIAGDQVTSKDLCEDCVTGYLGVEEKSDVQPNPPKMVETFFEFLEFLQQQVAKDKEALKALKPSVPPGSTPVKIPIKLGPPVQSPACPNCGITIEEIGKHSRLGCMKCYEFFGEALQPLLMRLHGDIKHVGKVPKKWKEEQEKKAQAKKSAPVLRKVDSQIIKQKLMMKHAVEQEDYEAAAKCRDRIKSLVPLQKEQIKAEKELAKALANGEMEKAQDVRKGILDILGRAAEIVSDSHSLD